MDRIVAMDRGNDSLKAALMENGVITRRWTGVDEDSVISEASPLTLAFSSVVPEFSRSIRSSAEAAGIGRIVEITFDMGMPFEILVDHPGKVGPDRLCAACGVIAEGVEEAVIVDAGTAVTVDLIDSRGFIGGCIFPGRSLLAAALSVGTAALPVVDITAPPGSPPGRSTEDAIQKGIFWGLAGAVTELVSRTLDTAGRDLPVFLTGGNGPMLEGYLDYDLKPRPDLVLSGIFHLAGIFSG